MGPDGWDALRSQREAVTKRLEARVDDLLARIGGLRSDQDELPDRALSFDVVSALRQIYPLWVKGSGVDESNHSEQSEHGHGILMSLLVAEEKMTPGVLKGEDADRDRRPALHVIPPDTLRPLQPHVATRGKRPDKGAVAASTPRRRPSFGCLRVPAASSARGWSGKCRQLRRPSISG